MPSFESLAGVFQKLESRHIAVHQDRCVKVRNRNASCRRCSDACTSGCITYADGVIAVLSENCIGCGTCATVCPTCAIEVRNPGDAELLTRAKRALAHLGSSVVFATQRAVDAAGSYLDVDSVVVVRNLGRVDETLLLGLAMEGAEEIVLVCDECGDASQAKGLETARKVCETASVLLEAWGWPCIVEILERFPSWVRSAVALGYDAGRRGFLSGAVSGARDALLAAGDYVGECVAGGHGDEGRPAGSSLRLSVTSDGTLPHFVPDRREYLLDALYAMGEPEDIVVETRLWGHAVIDADACTGCRACATFCPTGALSKYEEDGRVGISHAPSLCVKCLCCEDVCTHGAISVLNEVTASSLLLGTVDSYDMGPDPTARSNPHLTRDTMRSILGTQAISD